MPTAIESMVLFFATMKEVLGGITSVIIGVTALFMAMIKLLKVIRGLLVEGKKLL